MPQPIPCLGLYRCRCPLTPGYVRVCISTRSCTKGAERAYEKNEKKRKKRVSMSAEGKEKTGKKKSSFYMWPDNDVYSFSPPNFLSFGRICRKKSKEISSQRSSPPDCLLPLDMVFITQPTRQPPSPPEKLKPLSGGVCFEKIIINFGTFQRPALVAGLHRLL